MLSLDLWSLASSTTGSDQQDVTRQQLTFKDALQWLRDPIHSTAPGASWKVEVLTAHVEQIARYIVPLTRLVSALGFEVEDASTVADTVVFNSYVQDTMNGDPMLEARRYYLSDNTFGIYWSWLPSTRCTKVFMYGMTGEGTNQMQYVWQSLASASITSLSSPLLVGTVAHAAEVVEMRRWIAKQSDELVKLHIETGHHDYAETEHLEIDPARLADMSRDVCGFAINVSTSVLCLQRILKFADFLLDECESLNVALISSSGGTASARAVHEDIKTAQAAVRSRTQVWRRRADALLDEAETWKHKATILVQTVFTLTTQRDTGISIQIAHDSRTLAQKATRDSTSMKAIAAVTMCFLPGTFIASLFAMPMFEWPRAPDQVVSNLFWIYWVVTVPLTLVVIALWMGWTNRKELRRWLPNKSARARRDSKEHDGV